MSEWLVTRWGSPAPEESARATLQRIQLREQELSDKVARLSHLADWEHPYELGKFRCSSSPALAALYRPYDPNVADIRIDLERARAKTAAALAVYQGELSATEKARELNRIEWSWGTPERNHDG